MGTEKTISPVDRSKILLTFLLVALIFSIGASEKKVIVAVLAIYFWAIA
jgi:hypothetical protein